MRTGIEKSRSWAAVQGIPFYAIPAGRATDGLIPIYAVATAKSNTTLTTDAPTKGTDPLFWAMPATPALSEQLAPELAPLYEFTDADTGRRWYAVDARRLPQSAVRGTEPLCRVWRNPSSVLALDSGAKPVAASE